MKSRTPLTTSLLTELKAQTDGYPDTVTTQQTVEVTTTMRLTTSSPLKRTLLGEVTSGDSHHPVHLGLQLKQNQVTLTGQIALLMKSTGP